MARSLRIEFSGALYHVTSRGNARAPTFLEDADYQLFLDILEVCCERNCWLCHAYCLMTNHYHLLVETQNPTLSRGMRHINGTYTQRFNKRHNRVGHLFQGRYKSILVESNAYLLELARYIVLNPVRARMMHTPAQWPWSSYRATAGMAIERTCLTTDAVLASFSPLKQEAHSRYRKFVESGKNLPSPWEALKNQMYLGSDQFVEDMLGKIDPEQPLSEIPKPQKMMPPRPLEYYEEKYGDTRETLAIAYLNGHYTMAEIGRYFSVSYSTVSRAVSNYETAAQCKT
jgi:REP element-mobilizing transposase RayT